MGCDDSDSTWELGCVGPASTSATAAAAAAVTAATTAATDVGDSTRGAAVATGSGCCRELDCNLTRLQGGVNIHNQGGKEREA